MSDRDLIYEKVKSHPLVQSGRARPDQIQALVREAKVSLEANRRQEDKQRVYDEYARGEWTKEEAQRAAGFDPLNEKATGVDELSLLQRAGLGLGKGLSKAGSLATFGLLPDVDTPGVLSDVDRVRLERASRSGFVPKVATLAGEFPGIVSAYGTPASVLRDLTGKALLPVAGQTMKNIAKGAAVMGASGAGVEAYSPEIANKLYDTPTEGTMASRGVRGAALGAGLGAAGAAGEALSPLMHPALAHGATGAAVGAGMGAATAPPGERLEDAAVGALVFGAGGAAPYLRYRRPQPQAQAQQGPPPAEAQGPALQTPGPQGPRGAVALPPEAALLGQPPQQQITGQGSIALPPPGTARLQPPQQRLPAPGYEITPPPARPPTQLPVPGRAGQYERVGPSRPEPGSMSGEGPRPPVYPTRPPDPHADLVPGRQGVTEQLLPERPAPAAESNVDPVMQQPDMGEYGTSMRGRDTRDLGMYDPMEGGAGRGSGPPPEPRKTEAPEKRPGQAGMLSVKDGLTDFVKHSLRQVALGTTDLPRALREGFKYEDTKKAELAEQVSPGVRKALSLGSDLPLMRELEKNVEHLGYKGMTIVQDVSRGFSGLTAAQKRAVHKAAWEYKPIPRDLFKSPEKYAKAKTALDTYRTNIKKAAEMMYQNGLIGRETIEEFNKAGERGYVRSYFNEVTKAARFASQRLAKTPAKTVLGMDSKRQDQWRRYWEAEWRGGRTEGARQLQEYYELSGNADKVAEWKSKEANTPSPTGAGPAWFTRGASGLGTRAKKFEGIAQSVTSRKTLRDFDEAESAGMVVGTEPIVAGLEEHMALHPQLWAMREIATKPEYKDWWREPEKRPTKGADGKVTMEAVAPEDAGIGGWKQADGKAWGALDGKWIREDVYGNLETIVGVAEGASAVGELLRWANSTVGFNMVLGSVHTILKSFALESFIINYRIGVGLGHQLATIPKFVKTYNAYLRGERTDQSWVIDWLERGGEWHGADRLRRQLGDPKVSTTDLHYSDIASKGKQYRRDQADMFNAVLEDYLAEAEKKGGGLRSGTARLKTASHWLRGIDVAQALGLRVGRMNLSAEGLMNFAAYVDKMGKFIALYNIATKGGTTLPQQIAHGVRAAKGQPRPKGVGFEDGIRVIRDWYDMRSVPKIVNDYADVPMVGGKFTRAKYKPVRNMIPQNPLGGGGYGTRNPMGMIASVSLAGLVGGVVKAMLGVDDDEYEDARLIAANGDEGKAPEMMLVGKDDEGGTWWWDTSFFDVMSTANSFMPDDVAPGENKGSASELVGRTVRYGISQNPAGSMILQAGGYNPYFNSVGNPDLTQLIGAATPTKTMTDLIRKLSKRASQQEDGRIPSDNMGEIMAKTFTPFSMYYVAPPGTPERKRQQGTAAYVQEMQEKGGRSIKVPDTRNDAPSGGRSTRGRPSRPRRPSRR